MEAIRILKEKWEYLNEANESIEWNEFKWT